MGMGSRTPPKKLEDHQHPVDVIGRLRHCINTPYQNCNITSSIQVTENAVRVRVDSGNYRDFALDGISLGKEPLQHFYFKHVQDRIDGVRNGGQCTIIMYGATGSGKSYTMFGSPKEEGVAYRALHHLMDEREDGLLARVKVIEIYNEEIYDLLAANSTKFAHASPQKIKLTVRGPKVKNALSVGGKKSEDIARDLQLVERRRAVKSTGCNERSSRSHCMIILDIPSVGGRLVLVDMAGSENLDQSGICTEAKMQTGKINQGNAALKRVVEAIANGDSHIPYRDSKLTMLLQDSFEDDKSKILMILCASTDQKDVHKTISTLEYGAKAKCIVKLPKSPPREKCSSADHMILEARITVLNALVAKLQADNKLKDESKEEVERELKAKAERLEHLRNKVTQIEREKLCLMVNVLRTDEKLLLLMNNMETSINRFLETEIQRCFPANEYGRKIDEFLGKVKNIEAEVLRSTKEHGDIMVESSLSHYLHLPNGESCPEIVNNSEEVKETRFIFATINENQKQKSTELEVPLEDCNNTKKFDKRDFTDGSCYAKTSMKDNAMLETDGFRDANHIRNSLRDWDEEVQFTVICHDSEHQAVICKSCDQIDEFSSSDVDSEVLQPAAQLCSSADLDILNAKNKNSDVGKDRRFSEPATTRLDKNKDNVKTENCCNINSIFEHNSNVTKDARTIKNEGSLGTSFTHHKLSINDLKETHQPVAIESPLDMTSSAGVSFKGWLPSIPESLCEEEDSKTSTEGSQENHRTRGEELMEEYSRSSMCEVDNPNTSFRRSSSDSIITDFLRLTRKTSSSLSNCSELDDTSNAYFSDDKQVDEAEEKSDPCIGRVQNGLMDNVVAAQELTAFTNTIILRETTDFPALKSGTALTPKIEIDKVEQTIHKPRKELECTKEHRCQVDADLDKLHVSEEDIYIARPFGVELAACNTYADADNPIDRFSRHTQDADEKYMGRSCSSRVNLESVICSNNNREHEASQKEENILSEMINAIKGVGNSDSSSCSSKQISDADRSNSQMRSNSVKSVPRKSTEDAQTLIQAAIRESMISSQTHPRGTQSAQSEFQSPSSSTPQQSVSVSSKATKEMGGELSKEMENSTKVGSLPDCLGRKGCRLACLRPPRRIKLSSQPEGETSPVSHNGNQMPPDVHSTNKRKISKAGPSIMARPISRSSQGRDKMALKDKGSAVCFQGLPSNVSNATKM